MDNEAFTLDQQLHIISWELAVQMVAPCTISMTNTENWNDVTKDMLDYWQAYFYEKLKGGTDGK